MLAVDGLGVDGIGCLRLLQGQIEGPGLEGLVALINGFLVDHLSILEVCIVLGVSDFQGPLHIVVSSLEIAFDLLQTGTIDVAIGSLWELLDKAVDELTILLSVQLGRTHIEQEGGF